MGIFNFGNKCTCIIPRLEHPCHKHDEIQREWFVCNECHVLYKRMWVDFPDIKYHLLANFCYRCVDKELEKREVMQWADNHLNEVEELKKKAEEEREGKMSADNGIYILRTLGPEYRVAHLHAIDNIYWDEKLKTSTDSHDIMIENAREMFKSSQVFKTMTDASVVAFQLYDQENYVEYGVQVIDIPRKFNLDE